MAKKKPATFRAGAVREQSSSDATVTLSIKSMYFDRPAVQKMIGKKRAKSLSRMGAFIRQAARTAVLRRRKKTAAPGSPPSVHSRDNFATFRNVLFGLAEDGMSVVVGPVAFRDGASYGAVDTTPAPSLHEHGRSVSVTQRRRKNVPTATWRRTWSRPDHALYDYRIAEVRYPERKFMGPALLLAVKTGKFKKAVGG